MLIAFIGTGGGGGGGGESLLGRSLFVSLIIGLLSCSSLFSSLSDSEGSHLTEIHHSGISLLLIRSAFFIYSIYTMPDPT